MALTIDIKTNNEFLKAANAAADALDKIAAKEKNIDALSKKLGVSNKKILEAQRYNENKQLQIEKKKNQEQAEFRDKIKAGAAALYLVESAAKAAYGVTVDLGKTLLEMAHDAGEARRGAASMIDVLTGGRGKEQLEILDQWATRLGLSFQETRQDFIDFRKAGVDNTMAVNLIKLKADLKSTGMSAQDAAGWVSKVTSAGTDRYAAQRIYNQIRAVKGWHDLGDGVRAAEFATHSYEAAQNKLKNVADEKLADFWDKIGPSIGRAANRLADFIDSAAGGAAIDDIANAVIGVADAVNSDNMTTGLNVVKAIATAFEDVGEWIGKTASDIADFVNDALPDLESFGSAVSDIFSVFLDLDKKMFDAGANIIGGLIDGIKAGLPKVAAGVLDIVSGGITKPFTDALGIQSPSKLFADYGENTVEGFSKGQQRALGPMPIQDVASMAPTAAPQQSSGGGSITIENLIVHSGGSAGDIARSIREEIQLLLMSGQVSRGLA